MNNFHLHVPYEFVLCDITTQKRRTPPWRSGRHTIRACLCAARWTIEQFRVFLTGFDILSIFAQFCVVLNKRPNFETPKSSVTSVDTGLI